MSNSAHDLFLLLLNLAQLRSREHILANFLEAVNSMFDKFELCWLDSDIEFNHEIIEVATRKKHFGRIGVTTSGGAHSELGYALALGKRCFLMGERRSLFHWHADVVIVSDILCVGPS